MMSANFEYAIGSLLLLIALASPAVFCIAVAIGRRLPDRRPSRRWFRVIIYWAGACGVVMDMVCLYIAATFDPTRHDRMAPIDRIDSNFLTGVPTVFVLGIGAYTVLLCVALAAIAANAAAKRLGKALLHANPHRNRCSLPHCRPADRHPR